MREVEIVWGKNQDFVEHLALNGTRFLVVGGTAMRFHAPERRDPEDLDLMFEPSAETLRKINAALEHVEESTITASPEQFVRGNAGARFRLVLNVDVLTPPTGVQFAELWAGAEEAVMTHSSVRVRLASVASLKALLAIGLEREPARAARIKEDLDLLERCG